MLMLGMQRALCVQRRCTNILATSSFPHRRSGRPALQAAKYSTYASGASSDYPDHLLTSFLGGFLAPYWEITPSAEAAIAEVENWLPNSQVGFDHFAFRTFGLKHLGISSISTWFQDLGYVEGGALEFEKKRLRAKWFRPPHPDLPRLFTSELKVEELSKETQQIINKYAGMSVPGAAVFGKYGPATGFLGMTPWEMPTLAEYRQLEIESEYAAWVLVNGYALNHTTIAVHRLAGLEGGIEAVNVRMKERGLKLNQEGGEVKGSPDGLLLQSSTVADAVMREFADGELIRVPGAYIEFAERLVLPEFQNLKPEQVEERHRRDGFEVASADKIFESTTAAARELKNGGST